MQRRAGGQEGRTNLGSKVEDGWVRAGGQEGSTDEDELPTDDVLPTDYQSYLPDITGGCI